MNRTVLSRAAVLLLAATILASPVFAAGGRAPEREPGLFAAAWRLFARIIPTFQKSRQTIDPNGATADDDTEGRQTIDPNGATADDDTEGGWMIDPNG
jgi:hypothetical protein